MNRLKILFLLTFLFSNGVTKNCHDQSTADPNIGQVLVHYLNSKKLCTVGAQILNVLGIWMVQSCSVGELFGIQMPF